MNQDVTVEVQYQSAAVSQLKIECVPHSAQVASHLIPTNYSSSLISSIFPMGCCFPLIIRASRKKSRCERVFKYCLAKLLSRLILSRLQFPDVKKAAAF